MKTHKEEIINHFRKKSNKFAIGDIVRLRTYTGRNGTVVEIIDDYNVKVQFMKDGPAIRQHNEWIVKVDFKNKEENLG